MTLGIQNSLMARKIRDVSAPAPQIPATRHPESGIWTTKPETRNPEPGTRHQQNGNRTPESETQKPKPKTELETSILKPKT